MAYVVSLSSAKRLSRGGLDDRRYREADEGSFDDIVDSSAE